MYFDRFDILEAHYAFCDENHNGQTCPLYWRLCRIQNIMDRFKYSPGAMGMRGYDRLSDNAKEIYDGLNIRFAEKVGNAN